MTESQYRETIRIALVGRTGAGKSALGNTLVGHHAFHSVTGSESVTSQCQIEEKILPSGKILVVDTPGIMDSKDRDMKKEIAKSIAHLVPGPHAFLLVLQPNRATKEEIKSLTELKNLFGDDSYLRNTIIIMVRRNEILNPDNSFMDIHEFVANRTCEEVKELYQLCGRRIIAVDNMERDQLTKETYRDQILDMVKSFEGCYSHEYFKINQEKQMLLKLMDEEKKMLAIERKRLADLAMLSQQQLAEQKQQNQRENEARDKAKKELEIRLDKALTLLQEQITENNKKKCVIS